MEIDISKMSMQEFGEFLYLSTKLRNALDGGISYLNPAFRKLEGQENLELKGFSICLKEGFDYLGAMKEIAEKTPEDISFVVRYPSGSLENIYFLAGAKSEDRPEIKFIR